MSIRCLVLPWSKDLPHTLDWGLYLNACISHSCCAPPSHSLTWDDGCSSAPHIYRARELESSLQKLSTESSSAHIFHSSASHKPCPQIPLSLSNSWGPLISVRGVSMKSKLPLVSLKNHCTLKLGGDFSHPRNQWQPVLSAVECPMQHCKKTHTENYLSD